MCGVRVKNGDTNRAGTGCEDQHVVGVLVALGVGDDAAGAVKLLCVAVVDQVDVLCIPQFGVTEGQVLLGVLENLLDSNAVVGDVGLVVEDGDGVRRATGSSAPSWYARTKRHAAGPAPTTRMLRGVCDMDFPS